MPNPIQSIALLHSTEIARHPSDIYDSSYGTRHPPPVAIHHQHMSKTNTASRDRYEPSRTDTVTITFTLPVKPVRRKY
jgi:hypothetical protein